MATTSDFLRHLRTAAARQAHAALSDRQLLERFLHERSEAAFAALVARHGPMVPSVCRRVLHHAQDAEDAFQAAFLVLARKASSIRKQVSLGSWLHGVAFRSAECLKSKARRRAAYERRVESLPPPDAMDDITWRELRAVLDEELQRLPEKYRAPLVLCYLEARTHDEAARQLGMSKNTFGRRLHQARQLLAQRLTRRGLTLPAALTAPLLLDGAAQAALPPLLAANTVRAGLAAAMEQATGTLVSAQAAALVDSATPALLAKKATLAVALFVSLALGIGGFLVHRAILSVLTVPSVLIAEAPAQPSTPAHSATKDTAIEINGRVLGPKDKPVAGARLFLRANRVQKKAETNNDGRFRFPVRPADFGAPGKGVLIATAKGLGLDWIDVSAKNTSEEITLRLVTDDVPILGRVLDLEGKPIAGATVQVRSVSKRADGKDLAAFVERVEKYLKEGTPALPNKDYQLGPFSAAWYPFQWKSLRPTGLDLPATATTGKDGSFRLTGFGRDRVLELAIRGSTIAQTELHALTRNGPPNGWIGGHLGLYGCRIDYLAAPCKPISGTVRDKRTGKPLADISVWMMQQTLLETKTDSQGRYRILGAAKNKMYKLDAGGMPYFNHTRKDIADTPGVEPITVDFELERGIVVQGRLIDKSTGKPVQGEFHYEAKPNNPHLKDYSDANKRSGGFIPRTAPDGSFAVLAIPGPGLLCVQADDINRFAQAEENNPFQTYHAVVSINPSEKNLKSLTRDIALEPARGLKGSLVGPDGKPVRGAYAAGLSSIVTFDVASEDKLESDTFTVAGMKPGWPRTVVFFHAGKRIGKVVKLRGDETKPLLIRLEPVGAVAGRILDAKGRPWAGLPVTVYLANKGGNDTMTNQMFYAVSSWPKLTRRQTITDRDGKFRLEGMVPGMKYVLGAREKDSPPGAGFVYEPEGYVTAESGKTKDLGDLKSKRSPEK